MSIAGCRGDIVKRILLHWLAFVLVGTVLAMTLRWLTHPTEPLGRQLRGMFADFGPNLVALMALLPMFVLDAIKLTNRFAGPDVRFQRHIRALVANHVPDQTRLLMGNHADQWPVAPLAAQNRPPALRSKPQAAPKPRPRV